MRTALAHRLSLYTLLLVTVATASQGHNVQKHHVGMAKRQAALLPSAASGTPPAASSTPITDPGATSAPTPASTPAPTSATSTATQGAIGSFFSGVGVGISSFLNAPSSSATSASATSASVTVTSAPASVSSTRASNAAGGSVRTSSGATVTDVTTTSFVSAPSSAVASAPTASASSASDSGSSTGVGKSAMITIAVIASVVGAVAAVWTVIRKWKLSPSRRFERKLDDVDAFFETPRPPSFREKPDYYSLNKTHLREGSVNVHQNHGGYGAGGHPAEPPPAHFDAGLPPTAPWADGAAAADGGLARSDSAHSSASGGRQLVGQPYPGQAGPGFDSAHYPQGAHGYEGPHPGYPGMGRPASPAQSHTGGGLYPGTYDPTFRTASPGNFRSPSPGYPAVPQYRAPSPAAYGAGYEDAQQQQHYAPAGQQLGGPAGAGVLPIPGAGNGVEAGPPRIGTPVGMYQGAPGAAHPPQQGYHHPYPQQY